MEDRTERRATLVTSQAPVDHWHDLIDDTTFGDAILDRLVHHFAEYAELRPRVPSQEQPR